LYIIFIVIFGIEWILLCFLQESYFACTSEYKALGCSIFFFADIISLLSLIPDCVPLTTIANVPENVSNYANILYSALRILRLFRMWRVFKLIGYFNIFSTKFTSFADRLGRTYVTYSGMKSGSLLLILCFVLSIITFDIKYIGPPMTTEIIEGLNIGSPIFDSTVQRFIDTYPIIYLELDGQILYDAEESVDDFRDLELEYFTTSRTTIIMDASEILQGQAIFNIVKYTVLILVYFVAIYLLDRDVQLNFTKIFKDFITRTVKVAKTLVVYETSEDIFLNPIFYYENMLDRMVQLTSVEID